MYELIIIPNKRKIGAQASCNGKLIDLMVERNLSGEAAITGWALQDKRKWCFKKV